MGYARLTLQHKSLCCKDARNTYMFSIQFNSIHSFIHSALESHQISSQIPYPRFRWFLCCLSLDRRKCMEDKVSWISGSTGIEVREGSQFLKHSLGLVEQGACLQLRKEESSGIKFQAPRKGSQLLPAPARYGGDRFPPCSNREEIAGSFDTYFHFLQPPPSPNDRAFP